MGPLVAHDGTIGCTQLTQLIAQDGTIGCTRWDLLLHTMKPLVANDGIIGCTQWDHLFHTMEPLVAHEGTIGCTQLDHWLHSMGPLVTHDGTDGTSLTCPHTPWGAVHTYFYWILLTPHPQQSFSSCSYPCHSFCSPASSTHILSLLVFCKTPCTQHCYLSYVSF